MYVFDKYNLGFLQNSYFLWNSKEVIILKAKTFAKALEEMKSYKLKKAIILCSRCNKTKEEIKLEFSHYSEVKVLYSLPYGTTKEQLKEKCTKNEFELLEI